MTKIKVVRLASLVTAINVLVASGFSVAAIIRPQLVVPAGSVPTETSLILALYAAARTIPLALFALAAIYNVRRLRCWSWARSRAPCNCWMPQSVCLSVMWGSALGRSSSPPCNFSWFICLSDLCGSRRRSSADDSRTARRLWGTIRDDGVVLMTRLLDPITVGAIDAPNRIMMAPLTRGRATRSHVPTHGDRNRGDP
jgi:hypothetical protein